MKPIPVAFHIGPLVVHTYGIGLALTFWFAYSYFRRRLAARGYPTEWLASTFVWIIVAAIVGARIAHVLTNLSLYEHDPAGVLAVWHGGLSSFGGLVLAVPVGILVARSRGPRMPTMEVMDLIAPVLMAAWALGRLLGPQLMVAGGGHPTHQWFGMYYAGQQGRRIPVPIIQSLEDSFVFCVLIAAERRVGRIRASGLGGELRGLVLGIAMTLWGIGRFVDEHLWLGEQGHLGSALVQGAGIALCVAGLALMAFSWHRHRQCGQPTRGAALQPSYEMAQTPPQEAERPLIT
ncbi:MAG: prolipoprotein diacylglyceryl transferase [Acidimicrobiales bacterium]